MLTEKSFYLRTTPMPSSQATRPAAMPTPALTLFAGFLSYTPLIQLKG